MKKEFNKKDSKNNNDIEKIHAGHRARVKQKFLQIGTETMLDYEVLELLLFYSIPYKDTNVIAHRLINTFGSISSVFDASVENLTNVEGITENSATLLKMIPELSRIYNIDKFDKTKVFSVSKACEVFLDKYIGIINETVYLALINSMGRLVFIDKVAEGNLNKSHIYMRRLVKTALQYNAEYAILAHNHPSGVAMPSTSDIETTLKIKDILAKLNIILVDHIIIGNGDAVSLKSSKTFKDTFCTD